MVSGMLGITPLSNVSLFDLLNPVALTSAFLFCIIFHQIPNLLNYAQLYAICSVMLILLNYAQLARNCSPVFLLMINLYDYL